MRWLDWMSTMANLIGNLLGIGLIVLVLAVFAEIMHTTA
jgi:hypothetical protein